MAEWKEPTLSMETQSLSLYTTASLLVRVGLILLANLLTPLAPGLELPPVSLVACLSSGRDWALHAYVRVCRGLQCVTFGWTVMVSSRDSKDMSTLHLHSGRTHLPTIHGTPPRCIREKACGQRGWASAVTRRAALASLAPRPASLPPPLHSPRRSGTYARKGAAPQTSSTLGIRESCSAVPVPRGLVANRPLLLLGRARHLCLASARRSPLILRPRRSSASWVFARRFRSRKRRRPCATSRQLTVHGHKPAKGPFGQGVSRFNSRMCGNEGMALRRLAVKTFNASPPVGV